MHSWFLRVPFVPHRWASEEGEVEMGIRWRGEATGNPIFALGAMTQLVRLYRGASIAGRKLFPNLLFGPSRPLRISGRDPSPSGEGKALQYIIKIFCLRNARRMLNAHSKRKRMLSAISKVANGFENKTWPRTMISFACHFKLHIAKI